MILYERSINQAGIEEFILVKTQIRPALVRAGFSASLEGAIIDLDNVALWFARRGLPFHLQGFKREPGCKLLVFIGYVPGLDGIGRSHGFTEGRRGERFHLALPGICPRGDVSVRWLRPLADPQPRPAPESSGDAPAIPEPVSWPEIDRPDHVLSWRGLGDLLLILFWGKNP